MGIFQIHKEGKPLKVEGMWLKEKKKSQVCVTKCEGEGKDREGDGDRL